MSRSSSGRHSASRTSRSRDVSDGGASSACVAVAPAASGSWNTSRVCPMRISSPCWRRCEDQMRSPLIDVPFEDPRSLTHQPAGKCSRTACRRLAVGSSSSGTSFSAALPIVTRSASSGIRQLRTPEITSICGATDGVNPTPREGGAMSEPLLDARLLGGRYEVLETLGAGGEARVVKALDHRHERPVALKIRQVRGEQAREELLARPACCSASSRTRRCRWSVRTSSSRTSTSSRWTGSTGPTSPGSWPSAERPAWRPPAWWRTSPRPPRR